MKQRLCLGRRGYCLYLKEKDALFREPGSVNGLMLKSRELL
jgi:hypothetical protein